MWIDGHAASGWPSASSSTRMFSSPSLMPNCSRLRSRSTGVNSVCFSRPRGGFFARGVEGAAGFSAHEAKRAANRRPQLAAIDDQIQHAAFEQEFAALESVGQLLPDGLLDHPWAGETDERLG